MNYGLYLSAAGMMTNLHRQDVIANNLANANTTGFKEDLMAFQERAPEVIEDDLSFDLRQPLLDRIGGGVFVLDSRKDLEQGPLQETGNPFDIAIEGDGYFKVRKNTPNGTVDRLTRDGRMTLGGDGVLRQAAGSQMILDDQNQPIQLNSRLPISVDRDGNVMQDGDVVATLAVVRADDPSKLKAEGYGLFAPTEEAGRLQQVDQQVRQGFVEGSNVNTVKAMTQMLEASRAIQMHSNMLRLQNSMIERAATQLGRLA